MNVTNSFSYMDSVDRGKEMLGTFSPQSEPYNHVMPEETTPSGMFARGSYSARTKVCDIRSESNSVITFFGLCSYFC